MKQLYIRLTALERRLALRIFEKNLAALQKYNQNTPRQQQLKAYHHSLETLAPCKTLLNGSYYEWGFSGEDYRQILREINEGRNRDIREGIPCTDTTQLLLKLEQPRCKTAPTKQQEACL